MGAWGTGFFENDGALDALAELADDSSTESLMAIFDGDSEAYIETDYAESIVAAAALLAMASGENPNGEDQRIAPILMALGKPSSDIKTRAVAALERVLVASETAENWADADPADNTAWRQGIETMMAALRK